MLVRVELCPGVALVPKSAQNSRSLACRPKSATSKGDCDIPASRMLNQALGRTAWSFRFEVARGEWGRALAST